IIQAACETDKMIAWKLFLLAILAATANALFNDKAASPTKDQRLFYRKVSQTSNFFEEIHASESSVSSRTTSISDSASPKGGSGLTKSLISGGAAPKGGSGLTKSLISGGAAPKGGSGHTNSLISDGAALKGGSGHTKSSISDGAAPKGGSGHTKSLISDGASPKGGSGHTKSLISDGAAPKGGSGHTKSLISDGAAPKGGSGHTKSSISDGASPKGGSGHTKSLISDGAAPKGGSGHTKSLISDGAAPKGGSGHTKSLISDGAAPKGGSGHTKSLISDGAAPKGGSGHTKSSISDGASPKGGSGHTKSLISDGAAPKGGSGHTKSLISDGAAPKGGSGLTNGSISGGAAPEGNSSGKNNFKTVSRVVGQSKPLRMVGGGSVQTKNASLGQTSTSNVVSKSGQTTVSSVERSSEGFNKSVDGVTERIKYKDGDNNKSITLSTVKRKVATTEPATEKVRVENGTRRVEFGGTADQQAGRGRIPTEASSPKPGVTPSIKNVLGIIAVALLVFTLLFCCIWTFCGAKLSKCCQLRSTSTRRRCDPTREAGCLRTDDKLCSACASKSLLANGDSG
ncbi:hypothetical protein BOX15_Mlig015810g1, partial [Macrostomum lignano]